MIQGIKNTSNESFRRLLGNGLRYKIPKYQRDYSWTLEQWNDLWFDIQELSNQNISHYMGYLVLQTDDDKNFQIIDGQQRLTTICILLLAIIKQLKSLEGTKEEPEINLKRAMAIHSSFIGNIDMLTLSSENKITLNRNNDKFFKTYLSPLREFPKRGLNSSEKLMKNAFETFLSYIKNTYHSAEELISFVETIVDGLFFTVITVSDELNAFKVFETLNARGVQLSSVDLLKNYLFSVANDASLHQTQVDILEEKWSELSDILKEHQFVDYLRIYWNSKHKTVRKNQLYKIIKDNIKTSQDVFSLLDDLRVNADVYVALNNSDDEMWNNLDDIKNNLKLLKTFNVVQPLPLLLSAYNNLNIKEFEKLLKKIISITFRYNIICGKNPNELEIVYNKLAIQIWLERKYDTNILFSTIYIQDKEFEQLFMNKEFISNTRNNKIVRYILATIEHFEYGANIDVNESTLEHILPESPNTDNWNWQEDKIQQYRYRLGNMTLLERNKNSNIGNRSYNEKRLVYQQSTVHTTRRIGEEIEKWTEEEIEERQRSMAKIAKGIWKIT